MTGVKFLQFREFIRFISSQVTQVIRWVHTAENASAPKTVTTTKVQETVPRYSMAPGGTTRVTTQTWTVVTMAARTPPLTASVGTTGKDTTQPNRPTWKSSQLNRIRQTKSVRVKERLVCFLHEIKKPVRLQIEIFLACFLFDFSTTLDPNK